MKVALVVPGGVDRSGTRRVIPILLWLIERLVRAGDEVHVFALNQERAPGEWQLLGATVHNAGWRPRRIRALLAIARQHSRVPFDVIHAFWAGAPGQVASAFGIASGVPVVVTLPGGDLASLPEIGYGAARKWRSRFAIRLVLSRASAILAPSEWLAGEARARGWAPVLCPLGVALDRWPSSEPRRRQSGAPLRLIHVASLNRVKDPFTLLDAVRLLADEGVEFTLQVIGEDTLSGAVQRYCSALRLDDRVRFRGFVGTRQLRAHLADADLLVMSSLHEGALMVMLEAAVAGVPTVGTRVGYIADWAPDAAAAVPVRDPRALAAAIAALASDEDERMRLASAAHARAIDWDADCYAAQVRRIHADVARRTRHRTGDELPARATAPMGGQAS